MKMVHFLPKQCEMRPIEGILVFNLDAWSTSKIWSCSILILVLDYC